MEPFHFVIDFCGSTSVGQMQFQHLIDLFQIVAGGHFVRLAGVLTADIEGC